MRSRTLHDLVRRWWNGELRAGGRALDLLTAPAEALYRGTISARNARYDRGGHSTHPGVPVISVGNISVGGAGKTPFSAWLIQELLRRGRRPALLHGGYAADEPALHAAWAPGVPVFAGRDRVASAARAVAGGADVLVLDDAFQHRRIARDLDIVLVSAERWRSAPRLLPRGSWREPPAALRRAQLVGITRRTATAAQADAVAAEVSRIAPACGQLRIRLVAQRWQDGAGRDVAAPGAAVLATAIAEPDAFVANARSAGAVITAVHAWPDHHEYDAADAALLRRAAGEGAIVTTAKDWIKLKALLPAAAVRVLLQDVIIESGEQRLATALEEVLRG